MIDRLTPEQPRSSRWCRAPLKQACAGNFSLGNLALGPSNGQLAWNVGLFRTANTDDIINVTNTTVLGTGFSSTPPRPYVMGLKPVLR